ncbi:MAG: hypothetical protein ACK5OB_15485, partial [Pirellula sp.]
MDETKLNPYQSPDPGLDAVESPHPPQTYPPFGLLLIAAVLILGIALGLVSLVVQPLSFWTMPRFGWVGLIMCANPLIFVFACMRAPSKVAYWTMAFMFFFMALLQGAMLFLGGTVSVVQRPYSDRLHSAWLWSVVPYVIMCVYALWQSSRQTLFMVRPGQSGDA